MMTGDLTSRSLTGLAAVCLLGCSAGEPRHASDPSVPVDFGRRGEGRTFEHICRYESTGFPPAFSIFELTLETGGLTCFTGDRGVLFIPERGKACHQPIGLPLSPPRIVTQHDAAEEYRRCSAIALPPTAGPSQLTIYRPNPAHPQSGDLFIGFGLDAGALVSNDMLPVTLFLPSAGILCMESPNASRVAQHIDEADIADPSGLIVEFATGSCRDVVSDFERDPA